jgi:hypothetical protein
MPASPLPVFQHAPLSWFVLPLIRKMDHNKEALARRFPDMVLFVPPPSNQTLRDIERGEGQLFKSRKAEQVLLTITDVTQRAKEKVEELMKEHYQQWAKDREDNHQQKEEQSLSTYQDTHANRDEVYSQSCHDHLQQRNESKPPGWSLISADQVHPNDEGYDYWGRHIAAAIVKEWQDKLQKTV